MSLHLHAVDRQVDGQPWLSGIDLDLQPGRLHVLYGRTLSGKTSLLRLMAGLDRPSRGQILVDDRDAGTLSLQQRQVAFVYEQFVNYPSFTVAQNIAAPLRRAGCGTAECATRVQQMAQLLRIEHLLDRLPAQLSGGQQQRVAIARALAKDARLLLLDEPLVNLDYKLREELRGELRQLFGRGSDRIVVYTTTDPLEAMQLAGEDGEVVVLHEGRVLQRGSAAEVWHSPASDSVARLFADPPMNIVDVTLADGALHLGSLVLPLPEHMARAPAGPARIGQRAADLRFGHHITPHSVAGEVTLSEVNGAETVLHVQGGLQHWTLQIDGAHPMASGTPLAVHLAPQQMLLFDAAGRLLATPPRPGAAAHTLRPGAAPRTAHPGAATTSTRRH